MDKARWDKLAAAGGIVGVALIVVAGILYGSPPGVDDDATSVAEFFSDNRSQLLGATFIQGLALLAIVWFVAALVTAMRESGEDRLATAAFGSFLFAFGAGASAAIMRSALAYGVADEGPDFVLPLYHVSVVFDLFASLFGAGLFFAVAGATLRTGFLPRWWGWLSAIAGLWLLVSATAWAREGFWSPTGGVSWLGYIAFLLWFLVTSILLVRRTGGEPATSG